MRCNAVDRTFYDAVVIHEKGEKRTKQVLVLTLITMILEIIAGFAFGSMALLADGWHMGTHSVAFAITIFAYHYSRKHAKDNGFTFGTGKGISIGRFRKRYRASSRGNSHSD